MRTARSTVPGWGAVIGGIKTRTLEDNPNRHVDLAKGFLPTFRAARQRCVGKFLVPLKLNTTTFTPVGIDRHTVPQTYRNYKETKICSKRVLYVVWGAICKYLIFEFCKKSQKIEGSRLPRGFIIRSQAAFYLNARSPVRPIASATTRKSVAEIIPTRLPFPSATGRW